MSGEPGGETMDADVEKRLHELEARVKTLESLLRLQQAAERPAEKRVPSQPAAPWPAASPGAAPAPRPEPREPLDLEQLLGGRLLAWVGGVAVVLAAVFFLVMAVHNGWIDETARVVLAFFGSTVLLVAGVWLYELKGKTQAALAAVAAALAALYLSATTATSLYHLVSPTVGLVIAGLIGAAGTAVAVRWDSRLVAGIGLVGALLAPVLVDAGTSSASFAFMTVALVATIAVLVWRRWSWLAVAVYVASAPQAADWLDTERHRHLGLSLAVIGLFWALYVVAALGYELRVPTASLRVFSAVLLLGNAAATAAGGWAILDSKGNGEAATAWVLGVAAAHVLLGTATLRRKVSREIALLIAA